MKILERMQADEESDSQPQRPGVYTTGIVSQREARMIALFFTHNLFSPAADHYG